MTEEEKKAVDIIKNEITRPDTTPLEVYVTDIKILLNLIKKQQKEIEKLKQEMEERLIGREEITKYEMGYEIENNYISKDKIREKKKELENKKNYGNSIVFWEISSQIDLLNELLEEN